MALSINITARKIFSRLEKITNAKLNQLGLPTVTLTGTASTSQIADGAVTAPKTAFGPVFYVTDGGTANAHSLQQASNATPIPAALAAGMVFRYRANATNTGAVTVVIAALGGALSLYKQTGQELKAGDIRSTQAVEIMFTGFEWQLLSPTGQPENERYVETASADGLAYTATFSPTVTALTDGMRVLVKWNTTNTGAVTLAPNGLAAKAVRKGADAALAAGDLLDNQISELVYDSTANGGAGAWLLTSPVTINTPATVTGLTRGLLIKNNATNPTFVVDITADEAVLKNAGGLSYLAESVSVSANITGTVGTANSLDTGSEAGNTWYYLWLIYNGSTVASLISASSTAPTLPSGYTYKALVGEIYNDSGSNFVTSHRTGADVFLTETTISAALDPAAADTYEDLAGADLTAFQAAVPPTARVVRGTVGQTVGTSASIVTMFVAGTTSGIGAQRFVFYRDGGTGGLSEGPFEVPQTRAGGSRNIAWRSSQNSAANGLRITGYRT